MLVAIEAGRHERHKPRREYRGYRGAYRKHRAKHGEYDVRKPPRFFFLLRASYSANTGMNTELNMPRISKLYRKSGIRNAAKYTSIVSPAPNSPAKIRLRSMPSALDKKEKTDYERGGKNDIELCVENITPFHLIVARMIMSAVPSAENAEDCFPSAVSYHPFGYHKRKMNSAEATPGCFWNINAIGAGAASLVNENGNR